MSQPRIVVALDLPGEAAALALAERLDPARCGLKVGKELFVRAGPEVVRRLVADGFRVFLDLKFHDIPNTVAGACRAALDLGVWMVDVHAAGGPAMLEAARRAVGEGDGAPRLVAVTVLTSLDAEALRAVGMDPDPQAQVLRLARLSAACGLDGVVCSPRELQALREALPRSFLAVTPGVRPAGAAARVDRAPRDAGSPPRASGQGPGSASSPSSVSMDDQRRVSTPAEALAAGADHLLVGRPITAAPDPLAALAALERECG
jgi:orotidine-5'-phosphate decarboxylase